MGLDDLIPANSQSVAPPDWQPDIERLKRETQLAQAHGRSDPWTLAEVECWLDLIDAEIAAQAQLANDVALRALQTWKAELGALVRALDALQRDSRSSRPRANGQARAA